MSFLSTDFEFNGISSTPLGVKIVRPRGGLIGTPIAGGKKVHEQYIVKRDKPFFYETNMNPMKFKIGFTIEDQDAWDTATRKSIFEWLYSPRTYADFKTNDDYDDTGGTYSKLYKIIFTSPLEFKTADLTNGYFELTAQSHPFAYTETVTQIEAISSAPTQITINNPTNVRDVSNNFYYYPKMYVDLTGSSTSFKLTNTSDSNRIFELTSLELLEELYIDNDLKVINTNEADTNRIADLTDKRWFRLVQGDNLVDVDTTCDLQIVCQFPIML